MNIVDILSKARHVVAFTGAGISVESGIPDFRSPNGLWQRFPPEKYATFNAFLHSPENFWSLYRVLKQSLLNAHPNPAHKALVELEQLDILKAIITQNIDSLHTKAGSSKVYELHGSGRTAICLQCQKIYPISIVEDQLIKNQVIPRAPCHSDSLLKPDVVLFGEPPPFFVLDESEDEIKLADVVLVIGSSLIVHPAANLPLLAKNNGAKLVIINKEETALDDIADHILYGEAGTLLPVIVNELKKHLNSR